MARILQLYRHEKEAKTLRHTQQTYPRIIQRVEEDENKYIFLSVPNFTKSADEVKGSAEMWLYLLNHARDGGELPDFGSEIVEEALDRIRVENADDKLLEAQEHDMTTKEDYECWAAGKIIAAEETATAKAISVFEELGVSPEMIAQAKAMLSAEKIELQK